MPVSVSVHRTHSLYCTGQGGACACVWLCWEHAEDIESVCPCECVWFVYVCVYREQARPLATPGAQSPFPVVHCDKFPCQILPAPLYF